jgi:hypothetical protein
VPVSSPAGYRAGGIGEGLHSKKAKRLVELTGLENWQYPQQTAM